MKKVLSMMMIGGFVFGFTACGGGEEAAKETTEAIMENATEMIEGAIEKGTENVEEVVEGTIEEGTETIQEVVEGAIEEGTENAEEKVEEGVEAVKTAL